MSCNCIKKYRINIRSTIFKFHNPTTPLPRKYTSKEVDRPLHFENCSTGAALDIFIKSK